MITECVLRKLKPNDIAGRAFCQEPLTADSAANVRSGCRKSILANGGPDDQTVVIPEETVALEQYWMKC